MQIPLKDPHFILQDEGNHPPHKDPAQRDYGKYSKFKQVRENLFVLSKSRDDKDLKTFDIETNNVNSEKRLRNNLKKQLVKNIKEDAQDSGGRDGLLVSSDPPLEELGLVKTHKDQEVSTIKMLYYICCHAGWLKLWST